MTLIKFNINPKLAADHLRCFDHRLNRSHWRIVKMIKRPAFGTKKSVFRISPKFVNPSCATVAYLHRTFSHFVDWSVAFTDHQFTLSFLKFIGDSKPFPKRQIIACSAQHIFQLAISFGTSNFIPVKNHHAKHHFNLL